MIDQLTASGVRIIEEGAVPPRTLKVWHLADSNGQPVDADDHARCPGHAVMIDHWTGGPVAYCIEPDTHGDTDRYPAGTSRVAAMTAKGDDGKLTEQAKAERRWVIDHNRAWRAADPVRREYVKALLARKAPPKARCATWPTKCWADRTG